jgi:hypothetical protein
VSAGRPVSPSCGHRKAASLKFFLADEGDRVRAQKRGGAKSATNGSPCIIRHWSGFERRWRAHGKRGSRPDPSRSLWLSALTAALNTAATRNTATCQGKVEMSYSQQSRNVLLTGQRGEEGFMVESSARGRA